ncbi:MAG: type II secretion system protein [Candidatus Paceibacterota bacterium]|jgi:prepilin-type N-terminal cleavage/methylation domain-containing protein
MKNLYKQGITAIELIIVLAVLGIIFSIVIPQFSTMRKNQVLKSAVSDVLSALDEAKSKTLASLDSSSYGVHLESDKVIIFKGTVFLVNDANNETMNITTPASISNVTLAGISGNTGDIFFNRLSGSPNVTGTITISVPSISKIITISAAGGVSVN